MPLELVLTVCVAMAPAPSQCHDERLKIFEPDITLLQCMMSTAVMPDIIRWQQDHPKYHVVSWHCREAVPEKDA